MMYHCMPIDFRSPLDAKPLEKFFATCWVIVDAPCGRRLEPKFCAYTTAARAMPVKSMPPCS